MHKKNVTVWPLNLWSSVHYSQPWEEWYWTKLLADTQRISVPCMTTVFVSTVSTQCLFCAAMVRNEARIACFKVHTDAQSAPLLTSSQLVTYNKRWSSVHLRADTFESLFFFTTKQKAYLTWNNFLFTKKKWEWKQELLVSACSAWKRVVTKCCPSPKGKDAEVTRQQMMSELHTPSSWATGSGSQDSTGPHWPTPHRLVRRAPHTVC